MNVPDFLLVVDVELSRQICASFDSLAREVTLSDLWYSYVGLAPRGQFMPWLSAAWLKMFMEWQRPRLQLFTLQGVLAVFRVAQTQDFVWRWVGGDSTKPTFTTVVGRRILRYNHWYDVVVHAVLSPEPKVGYVVWWVDGVRLFRRHLATLFRRPDGSVSSTQFKVGHYRSTEPTVDVNYIDGVKVGRTARSRSVSKPKTRR